MRGKLYSGYPCDIHAVVTCYFAMFRASLISWCTGKNGVYMSNVIPKSDSTRNERKTASQRRSRYIKKKEALLVSSGISLCRPDICFYAESGGLLPVKHKQAVPRCSHAVKGEPCVLEQRIFDDTFKRYSTVFSDAAATLIAKIFVRFVRRSAKGEDTTRNEIAFLKTLLHSENQLRRLHYEEQRLRHSIEAAKPPTSWAEVLGDNNGSKD